IPLYLHIDLSVLDPAIMPAVIDPVSKGLSLETFISFIDAVTAGVPPVALGISNFHPDRDRENIGLKTSLEAITSAVRILSIE
ncbi:MAG: arginase family protein, partial [Anaerolineales bacterium]|nr:arginase family protein [Anaerolineales bacterium]